MEATGVIIGILVVLGLFFVVWAAKNFKPEEDESREERLKRMLPDINVLFKSELDKYTQTHDTAPYKLEPPESAVVVAVAEKPKRKYTKRSTYWNSRRVKNKMRKARAAKKRKTGIRPQPIN